MNRHTDARRTCNGNPSTLIGDDLTDAQLDELWSYLGGGVADSDMAQWFRDKPHQVAYRLLLRLTRAEACRD